MGKSLTFFLQCVTLLNRGVESYGVTAANFAGESELYRRAPIEYFSIVPYLRRGVGVYSMNKTGGLYSLILSKGLMGSSLKPPFFQGDIFEFFVLLIQHCFICRRPSDFSVSEDAGIESRTLSVNIKERMCILKSCYINSPLFSHYRVSSQLVYQ